MTSNDGSAGCSSYAACFLRRPGAALGWMLPAAVVSLATVATTTRADVVIWGDEQATLAGEVDGRLTNQGTIYSDDNSVLTLTGEVDGAGTYVGDVTFDGVYRPGNSPAIVNFQNNLTFGSGNVLIMEIGGTAPGSEHDQLNVGGVLTAGGVLRFTLIDVGGGVYSPQSGDEFQVFTWGSLNGAFTTVELPDLAPGLSWDDSQLQVSGSLSVVPESPFIGALAALLAWRYGRPCGR